MLCLHSKPAGDIIYNPALSFALKRNKGIKGFLATKQDIPKCCGIIHPDKRSSINRYWINYYKYRTYTGTTPPERYNPYEYLGPYVSAADTERHYAKFRVYTGKEQHKWWAAYKKDIGRPFFVCGNGTKRNPRGCGYFEWGDKIIAPRPLCHHGALCSVKGKPGEQFFGCPRKDTSCGYFEWITKTQPGIERKGSGVQYSEQTKH